jgi:hypothetical protein
MEKLDMTDAEKLEEILNRFRDNDPVKWVRMKTLDEDFISLRNAACAHLSRLRDGGWRPISEAPKQKSILCSYKRNSEMAVLAFKHNEWRDSEGVAFYGPDFWQPLPPPPEGE